MNATELAEMFAKAKLGPLRVNRDNEQVGDVCCGDEQVLHVQICGTLRRTDNGLRDLRAELVVHAMNNILRLQQESEKPVPRKVGLDIADRLSRALVDSFNRSGEVPTQEDVRAAICHILDIV